VSTTTTDLCIALQALTRPELKPLLEDMKPLPVGIREETRNVGSGTYLWVGPKGIITPIHHDPLSLFHAHVRGAKRWLFWPPDSKPLLYNYVGVYSRCNPLSLDFDKYPLCEQVS
jgi:hypothetical protein